MTLRLAAADGVDARDRAQFDAARRLIAQAAAAGAHLVALPEYFCLMGRADRDKLAIAEAPWARGRSRRCSPAARTASGSVGGSLPMRIAGVSDRVRNACCVFADG